MDRVKKKVVLISDAYHIQGRLIEEELREFFSGAEVQVFNCRQKRIEYCIGCYTCHYKTPGKCIFNDDMDELLRSMAQADILVFLSEIQFGCYSSATKRALDRILPLEIPFIRTVQGETHFMVRYHHKRMLLTVAYSDKISASDAVLFSELTQRNAINFDADVREPVFFQAEESVDKKLRKAYGDLI